MGFWILYFPKVKLNYIMIHGSNRWGHVSMVYSPKMGPKGPTLVRFHIIKNKK